MDVNMKQILILHLFLFSSGLVCGGPDSITKFAKITASSEMNPQYTVNNISDGIIGIENSGEWAAVARNRDYPWIRLSWDSEQCVNKIVLYDRPSITQNIAGCRLEFSDGSRIWVTQIPSDGTAKVVDFEEKFIKWVRIVGIDGNGTNLGFSEVEVFPSPKQYTDYVDWVDPYIETNRGRYFFFVTGNLPYSMSSAAPLTRNKNQDGGGYNYNEREILGFSQIHWWSMSGIEIMPAFYGIDPIKGEEAWKSEFSHDDEIVQPGYHRVYLRTPRTWVEQTVTDRVSFYRFTFTQDTLMQVITNLGGFLGNSVMANAEVKKVNDCEFEGSFSSIKRPWGGPKDIKVFFVIRFDKPQESMEGWSDGKYQHDLSELKGVNAGVSSVYKMQKGDKLQMKIAFSLTTIDNARNNMNTECDIWDFEKVRKESRNIWNQWFSKIDVKGGTDAQKKKFYTDMWHVLLGRHKINDVSGDYPDRTEGVREGRSTDAIFKIKTIPKNSDGKLKFNMYNFDAHWGAQWNLDIIWGLAYPEVADDFAASLIEYADNGYLLPRGPVGGGYSYIMRGNPSAHHIVSTYMMGLLTKQPNAKHAYEIVKRNNLKGGIIEMPPQVTPADIEFYNKNGWVPGNAGITLDLCFQDWVIAQMAKKLKKNEDYDFFMKRSHGWQKLFDQETKFIYPKDSLGKFSHKDPLSGRGWVETNSWQATFSVAHDLKSLARLMGGEMEVAKKLNTAFTLAEPDDFISEYHSGYVAYSNQPSLSNAHVFSYMKQPWLTQYWVRKVKEKAYGGITPDLGYGGHDEDQGQMGGISALMAIGLFNVHGNSTVKPFYEITSPIFDEITIQLDNKYYEGKTFIIKTYNNSVQNCYIQKVHLNGNPVKDFRITHRDYTHGGILEIWLGNKPNREWGVSNLDLAN